MERTKHNFLVLTNDPSLTEWGWAVTDLTGHVFDAGCIKTEPEHKKRRIRTGDDRCRRIDEINNVLLYIIDKYQINLLLSEQPHGSQNASGALMIGIVLGMVQTLARMTKIPLEWYSEQDAKKALLNKKTATKAETIQAISKIYKVPWTDVKYKDEAIADAMAVYHVASQQSTAIKMMRQ